ncbi:MAG: NAD-dependent DNA ligase LigA [Clostridia bacterium]|nr:NAD-dependent DNA ligase LigA [Clostridia bacterium]
MPNLPQDIQERMLDLIRRIRQADQEYYVLNEPTITDREYDMLRDELKDLEEKYGFAFPDSPTDRVSGDVSNILKQVRHTQPMLSANKTKDVREIEKFAGNRPVVMSWKLDGLTLVLRYKDGVFQQGITRGRNGIVGEDVTHTVKTFLNVPMRVHEKRYFEVRGEGVISWKNFDELNQALETPYGHPRNLASGSVRQLDPEKCRERKLEFWAFELISDRKFETKIDQMVFMEANGFSVVPNHLLAYTDMDALQDAIDAMQPKDYEYPVDGLIFEYDDLEYGKSLGATGHHRNSLMALKWADELFETTLRDVELATTRTGKVSMTAVFDPVEIDHTNVNKAYLHNVNNVRKLRLGIGDRITVYKANMIIPQIAENLTRSDTYLQDKLPICPCCGNELEIVTSANGTMDLYCNNPHCSAKLVQRFVHFCSKTRMEINGLSEQTLSKFVSKGWIKNFGDLYGIDKYRDEIVETDGFGKKSYEKLIDAIESSRDRTMDKFLAGLGIPQIGRNASLELARYFDWSWEQFEQALKEHADFSEIKDFGRTMSDNLINWYYDPHEESLWRPALEYVRFQVPETKVIESNPFLGKTVVATGKLDNYSRDGIKEKLISLGAKPTGSVSERTDYVITGEKAGGKLKKARELSIRILTESEFEDMLLETS